LGLVERSFPTVTLFAIGKPDRLPWTTGSDFTVQEKSMAISTGANDPGYTRDRVPDDIGEASDPKTIRREHCASPLFWPHNSVPPEESRQQKDRQSGNQRKENLSDAHQRSDGVAWSRILFEEDVSLSQDLLRRDWITADQAADRNGELLAAIETLNGAFAHRLKDCRFDLLRDFRRQ
jgi:hypothetical protein